VNFDEDPELKNKKGNSKQNGFSASLSFKS
jgi:hypothetical protein